MDPSSLLSPDVGRADFAPPITAAPAAEPLLHTYGRGHRGKALPVLRPLGLQVTEKSFYDALGQKYPPSPNLHQEEPPYGSQFLANQLNSVTNIGDGMELLAQNIFTDSECVLQFRRGLEEASKFLPWGNHWLLIWGIACITRVEGEDQKVEIKGEKGERENSPDGLRGRKNHEREDVDVLLSTEAISLQCGNNDNEPMQNEASRKQLKQGEKKETVDLKTLLILCAQAVSVGDNRTSNELLKQIRQHSSLMVKGFREKATSLHIIDFGIEYGFHWPLLIHKLSKRAGGPPKLRITGIEFPQPGFRPTERIEETGRRLAKYCERFNVPFEYHALASQNWETIQIEDLKIDRNEMLAVNCPDYKGWFQAAPIGPRADEMLRSKMKEWYHKDFVLDEDNHWMLQGWKGRILYASSCWVPN
ncbi:hypothetical protein SLA2020_399470 [Shorea laevis]